MYAMRSDYQKAMNSPHPDQQIVDTGLYFFDTHIAACRHVAFRFSDRKTREYDYLPQ